MKRILLSAFAIAIAIMAGAQTTKVSFVIGKTGVDQGVDVSSDDAEQLNSTMDKLYDDDLDAGWEGDDFNVLVTGLRFTGVNLLQGSTVDSAYLEIWAHEDEADLAIITIKGENADNSTTFDLTNLLTDRPMTSAELLWNLSDQWTMWEKYRTPDFAAVVQEIIDRPGWQSGNSMSIFLIGEDQGASSLDNARDFESFENIEDPADGGDGLNHPERYPRLIVVVQGSVGIRDFESKAQFSIGPNPAENGKVQFHINRREIDNFDIEFRTISGQLALSFHSPANNILDVSSLNEGMYLVTIRSGGEQFTQRLVIR